MNYDIDKMAAYGRLMAKLLHSQHANRMPNTALKLRKAMFFLM